MRPRGSNEIPAETAAVVRAACPKGTRVTRLRDVLGPVFNDEAFASWFSAEGRPGMPPGLLALVCVLQALEDLTDRQAADAVRTRLDWKYALGLALDDPGFDFSVLSEFRDRLAVDDRAEKLLATMLVAAKGAGLVRAGGKARTDSTHVLAAIRKINRMELIGESLRLALEQLAEVAPGWLAPRLRPEWEDRYVRRIESGRMPAGDAARSRWAAQTAADGGLLLALVTADVVDGPWLVRLPHVKTLADVWDQACNLGEDGVWRFRKECLLNGPDKIDSPHDPDARWSKKRSTAWIGYKIHLTEACDADAPRLITHVATTHAAVCDMAALPDVQAGLEEMALRPGEHFLDGGYVTIEAIADAKTMGTDLVGPVTKDNSWQAKAGLGYDRDSFVIDWDHRTAICPDGKTSRDWHDARTDHGTGARIGFDPADCRPCPSRMNCTRDVQARKILIPPRQLHDIQLGNRHDQHDPAWLRRYDQRAGIEGTISAAVRAHGARRCKYQGHDKTRVQHVLIACAMNAARIADWHERSGQNAAPRPHSRLKVLFATTAS